MKFPISNFQFPKFKAKSIFIKILFLFFGILFIFGSIFFGNITFIEAYDECAYDGDCRSGEICDGENNDVDPPTYGICVLPEEDAEDDNVEVEEEDRVGVGGYCSSGAGCQAGLECQRNTCTLPDDNDGSGGMCTYDVDCGGGLECISEVCTNTSDSPSDDDGGGNVGITNPISSDTILDLIARVMGYAIGLIGVVAVASFMYGGILYLLSGGSEEQSGKAKKVLGYSVLGLIVSILSYVIVSTIINIISGT